MCLVAQSFLEFFFVANVFNVYCFSSNKNFTAEMRAVFIELTFLCVEIFVAGFAVVVFLI